MSTLPERLAKIVETLYKKSVAEGKQFDPNVIHTLTAHPALSADEVVVANHKLLQLLKELHERHFPEKSL